MNQNHIGKRIRELRKENDFTQEKLANYLNVSYQTVSKWENGVNTPDLAQLVPLARLLRTTTDDLLGHIPTPEGEEALRKELEDAWNAERQGAQNGERLVAAAEALVKAFPRVGRYWYFLAYGEYIRANEVHPEDGGLRLTYYEQALRHCDRTIEECDESYWREEALEMAANILSILNRKEEALGYANQLPEGIRRDRAYRQCLPEEERIRHVQKMRYREMLRFLNELIHLLEREQWERTVGKKERGEYRWAAEVMIATLDGFFSDGNALHFHMYYYTAWMYCARLDAENGEWEKAREELREALRHIRKRDAYHREPGIHRFTAPLVDRLETRNPASENRKDSQEEQFWEILRTKKWAEGVDFYPAEEKGLDGTCAPSGEK